MTAGARQDRAPHRHEQQGRARQDGPGEHLTWSTRQTYIYINTYKGRARQDGPGEHSTH